MMRVKLFQLPIRKLLGMNGKRLTPSEARTALPARRLIAQRNGGAEPVTN
jgi:hypothetical protein